MRDDYTKTLSDRRRMTLNTLKDELHSLNMRLLLAMQHHNVKAQEDIREEMASLQAEISQMCGGYCRQP